ncbi:hypothetical protein Cni_G12680 [Canna indica]|uniref:DUF7950 domain-containing protein n=1 Tax=Canna indica TaxID=4628 RepID=A0AAQ3QD07_9LILI|nr:hypothetical protein Cni_G12680 [Canna indica]
MFRPVDMAKTHEILARFRPIAPKPSPPPPPLADGAPKSATPPAAATTGSLHLCGPRPCRARKRGRGNLGSAPGKRQRTILPAGATPPSAYPTVIPFSAPAPRKSGGELLSLSLLPRPSEAVPVEQDLLQKLQEPKVIAPQPVRPVGSSISVALISPLNNAVPPVPVSRRPEEVEEEVESDALPAVVSDSRNRVRLANSAYKEMVGQPECPWLDSMMLSNGSGGVPRRISGEVMLDLEESSVPKTSTGFSCRVRIEWACNGKKNFVNAPCSVIRLFCESKDYLFAWRFDTSKASGSHCKA